MFKKIALVAIFTLITAAPSVTLAADTKTTENTNAISVRNEVASAENAHAATLTSANADNTNDANNLTPSASAWMLAIALVGFVLLSNRRAI